MNVVPRSLIVSAIIFRLWEFLRQALRGNAEPRRGVFSFLEYSNIDRGVLGDYGMQLAIMDN